jgi:CDGSH-type Zn-finger protein
MPYKPVIVQRTPCIIEVVPGSVYWGQCGQSKTQPFCDRSHTETEFSPMETHFEEKKRVAFCGCKQTKNPPFRDGSHSRI